MWNKLNWIELNCIAGLRSWCRVRSSFSRGDPASPSVDQPTSWPGRREPTRWVVCLGSPPDNELCWPIGLDSRKKLLIGAEWIAVRLARRSSRSSTRCRWRFSIHSAIVESRWGMTPGRLRAASACGTWFWWPCRSLRGPARRGARMLTYCWHTDWRGKGRSNHCEPPQPAYRDEMTWPSGRTPRTSDPKFMKRCCERGRAVN
jgi:hypothetical protein